MRLVIIGSTSGFFKVAIYQSIQEHYQFRFQCFLVFLLTLAHVAPILGAVFAFE
jgi:hypothetical protein